MTNKKQGGTKMLIKRTVIFTILLTLLVGSIAFASNNNGSSNLPNGNLAKKQFVFENLAEYDDNTLEVVTEETDYKITINVLEKLKKEKNEDEKADEYSANVTIDNNSSIISFENATLRVQKERLDISEIKKGHVANIVTYDKEQQHKLNLSFGWVNDELSLLTGSALIADYSNDQTKTTFLTLGEFSTTIKNSKKFKESQKVSMGSLETQESVLLRQDSYDDNNLRVSLNRNTKTIVRGENALVFFAAAPKSMNDDDFTPDITHAKFTIDSVGSNAVVTRPFATWNTKPQSNDSVSVGFSYYGIGGSYSWSVGSDSPNWYEGTTGVWDFSPDIYYTQALNYGIPVEGYLYGDQAGTVKIEATTDIDWREYYKDSTSITGMRIVTKNNIDWHGPVSFEVINP